jgi:hypothetical protein
VERPKITFKKFLEDLYFMLCGKDGQIFIRRFLAVVFSAALIHLYIFHITNNKEVQEAFIWGFISMIVALLGLTTWQNLKDIYKT